MDAILGLGHFCETHGPCVILSTQRCKEEPQQLPHNLSVPWCESCQSIDLDQSLVSKDETTCYVTTRTPLQQDLAFLLKQAAVRSLSCEETRNEGGTMYFGDNERGHIISHTFTLQDSLARGFHRKYSILMLMRDKIHLLNSWTTLAGTIRNIASELQTKAGKINDVEQSQCSQRAVRQAQGSPNSPARSLSQLTGEPTVFAQLHMWFAWLLSIEIVVEKPLAHAPSIPIDVDRAVAPLRAMSSEMKPAVFRTVAYCILTGIPVEVVDDAAVDVADAFRSLLPKKWSFPKSGETCRVLRKDDGTWKTEWSGCLPPKLPRLQTLAEEALSNDAFPENVLKAYVDSVVLKWHNIAKTLSLVDNPNPRLLQALGVQNSDLPLLAYWTAQCRSDSAV